MLRVCAGTNCPRLVRARRCPDCARAYELTRGTTTARGYGTPHQSERASWAPHVAAGHVDCRRASNGTCLRLALGQSSRIAIGEPWDLGHPDTGCLAPTAPEHRDCNRAAARRHPAGG